MALPAAVGSLNKLCRGEVGCRHAKHIRFCITSFQQMQPQPRLRHHENSRGSRNQVLPNPTLLRQLLWKPEKKDVLDNIKMLKCKARLYPPAGSSPPCRKCYRYRLLSASGDGRRVSSGQLLLHRFVLLGTFGTPAVSNKPKICGRCHSPPPHF